MSISTTIRGIAFDAVGTLIYPEPSVATAYHAVGQRYGSQLPRDEISQRFRQIFRQSEQDDQGLAGSPSSWATSEPRERARWRQIVDHVLDDVADLERCFDELYAHFADPAHWKCFDDVGPVLAALQAAGVRLAIASNFDARLHAVCDGFPELTPIATRVVSSEVGFRKPSPAFYRSLCAEMGCSPAELLMVGDDYENDVVGAQQSDLQAILLDRKTNSEINAPGTIRRLDELFALIPFGPRSP